MTPEERKQTARHQRDHEQIESLLRRSAQGASVGAALQHEVRLHLATCHGMPGLPHQPAKDLLALHDAQHPEGGGR